MKLKSSSWIQNKVDSSLTRTWIRGEEGSLTCEWEDEGEEKRKLRGWGEEEEGNKRNERITIGMEKERHHVRSVFTCGQQRPSVFKTPHHKWLCVCKPHKENLNLNCCLVWNSVSPVRLQGVELNHQTVYWQKRCLCIIYTYLIIKYWLMHSCEKARSVSSSHKNDHWLFKETTNVLNYNLFPN